MLFRPAGGKPGIPGEKILILTYTLLYVYVGNSIGNDMSMSTMLQTEVLSSHTFLYISWIWITGMEEFNNEGKWVKLRVSLSYIYLPHIFDVSLLCLLDVGSAPTPGACTHIRKIFFSPFFLVDFLNSDYWHVWISPQLALW